MITYKTFINMKAYFFFVVIPARKGKSSVSAGFYSQHKALWLLHYHLVHNAEVRRAPSPKYKSVSKRIRIKLKIVKGCFGIFLLVSSEEYPHIFSVFYLRAIAPCITVNTRHGAHWVKIHFFIYIVKHVRQIKHNLAKRNGNPLLKLLLVLLVKRLRVVKPVKT